MDCDTTEVIPLSGCEGFLTRPSAPNNDGISLSGDLQSLVLDVSSSVLMSDKRNYLYSEKTYLGHPNADPLFGVYN